MKKEVIIKLTIILMAWASMADCIVTPISVNIMGAFPDMMAFQLNFILSGAMLISIPSAIFFGKLAQTISKKTLLIFGYAIYVVSGLLPIFFDYIPLFMICRGMAGVTCGCLGACAFSMIAELYHDERVSSSLIGFYNAFGGIAGVAMSTSAGYLALADWHYAFYLNAFGIIPLLMIIFLLPLIPPEKIRTQKRKREPLSPKQWIYVASAAIYCCLCMPTFYFVAVYVIDVGIGDSSTAGILSSLLTIGSTCSGLIFSIVFKKLRLFTESMLYFITAFAMILMFFCTKATVAGALFFIVGFGYGTCLSYFYMIAVTKAPPERAALASGMINAALSGGCFLCTYLVLFMVEIIGLASMTEVFLACGVLLVICGIIMTGIIVQQTRRIRYVKPNNK